MRHLMTIFLLSAIIYSCDPKDENKDPYIVFLYEGHQIDDTLVVSLNDYREIIIESKGDANPKYYLQLNQNLPEELPKGDFLKNLKYSNGSEGIHESAEFFYIFSDELYNSGDVLRLKVQVTDFTKSVYFKIY